MLSMHELSLPEPMVSLSMLILATYPVAALDVTRSTPSGLHILIKVVAGLADRRPQLKIEHACIFGPHLAFP